MAQRNALSPYRPGDAPPLPLAMITALERAIRRAPALPIQGGMLEVTEQILPTRAVVSVGEFAFRRSSPPG